MTKPDPDPTNLLAGPRREVVYIFEREGTGGGEIWLLVLECGHMVARKRYVPKSDGAIVQAMFRPLSAFTAPKRVQCHYCGSGSAAKDPWVMIEALGGPHQ